MAYPLHGSEGRLGDKAGDFKAVYGFVFMAGVFYSCLYRAVLVCESTTVSESRLVSPFFLRHEPGSVIY